MTSIHCHCLKCQAWTEHKWPQLKHFPRAVLCFPASHMQPSKQGWHQAQMQSQSDSSAPTAPLPVPSAGQDQQLRPLQGRKSGSNKEGGGQSQKQTSLLQSTCPLSSKGKDSSAGIYIPLCLPAWSFHLLRVVWTTLPALNSRALLSNSSNLPVRRYAFPAGRV